MYRVSTSLLMIWVLMNLMVVAAQERAATHPTDPGGSKQALVIGNSAYTHTSPLKNPVNDAKAIGSTLQQFGFEVITLLDVNQRQMEQALRRFGSRLQTFTQTISDWWLWAMVHKNFCCIVKPREIIGVQCQSHQTLQASSC